jgi:hypothetical protein
MVSTTEINGNSAGVVSSKSRREACGLVFSTPAAVGCFFSRSGLLVGCGGVLVVSSEAPAIQQ